MRYTDTCSIGRWRIAQGARIALATFGASFLVVPLVGTEFVPDAEQIHFAAPQYPAPVGSSLEYTNSKMQQVEEALKSFPEVALIMTTIGTNDGRICARVNLRLTEGSARDRSQKDIERAIRTALKPVPGIELAIGYDRPVWVNLMGPDPETLTTLIGEFAQRVAKVPGIADLEISEQARNPAPAVHLNNDTASDLGIKRSTGRPHGSHPAHWRHRELLARTRRAEL